MPGTKAPALILALLFTLLAPPAPPALADEEVPQYVKLPSFMVPAKQPGVSMIRMRPVTLVIELRLKEHAALACDRFTKIRDAVVTEIFRTPIPLRANGRMRLYKVRGRLRRPINRALGVKAAVSVFVFRGEAIPWPRGGRHPVGGSGDCERLALELPGNPQ